MTTRNIPGRGLAILVGLAFLVASLSALFGEDLTNWHSWTMKHYEVLAILFGATASGLLCRYAKRARMWIACVAFGLLFVATTGLVVYKSLGRQAAATATQTMSAEDSNKLIADKMGDLATTRQRLTDAEREVDYERKGRPDRQGKPTVKAGCGDRCKDWERRSAEVRSRVQVLEQEIRSIGPRQVAAPEAENFAQLMGIFGWSTTKVKALAVLLVPVLWTMVLEAGTIACFEYAFSGKHKPVTVSFSDSVQTSFSTTKADDVLKLFADPIPENDPEPPKPRKTKKPTNVVRFPTVKHPVLQVLETSGRTMSNGELAKAMGVSDSEASKRWQEVSEQLEMGWNGKFRTIGLKAWKATA
jgi:hypothetical protein